jgi:hypothetical protein
MSTPIRAARLGLLIIALMLGTFALGWVGVPCVALAFAAFDGRPSSAWESALAAGLSWGLILALTAVASGGRPLAIVGAALGAPPFAIPLVAIVFAVLLAWTAATIALGVRALASRATARESIAASDRT